MIPPDPYGSNGILASVPPECHAPAHAQLPPVETATQELVEVAVDGLWLGPITISFTRMKIRNRRSGSRWIWSAYRADKVEPLTP